MGFGTAQTAVPGPEHGCGEVLGRSPAQLVMSGAWHALVLVAAVYAWEVGAVPAAGPEGPAAAVVLVLVLVPPVAAAVLSLPAAALIASCMLGLASLAGATRQSTGTECDEL